MVDYCHSALTAALLLSTLFHAPMFAASAVVALAKDVIKIDKEEQQLNRCLLGVPDDFRGCSERSDRHSAE